MRLIDADALIDFIDLGHLRNQFEACFSERDVVDMLESRPTIDAVPVVRCRECVGRPFWQKNDNEVPVCLLSGLYVRSEDDFCPYGERKEEHDG